MNLSPMAAAPVVLAEDDPDDQVLFSELWEEFKLPNPLIVLPDGDALLKYVKREPPYQNAVPPCLILTDWYMPKLEGEALLERLRSEPASKDVPIVVLTSAAVDEHTVWRMGAKHLRKSVDYSDFLDGLQSVLEQYLGRLPNANGVQEEDSVGG